MDFCISGTSSETLLGQHSIMYLECMKIAAADNILTGKFAQFVLITVRPGLQGGRGVS
jgi:hypothetical protein